MQRFLLDENVPIRVRDTLKAKGFRVALSIEVVGAGVRNHDIANFAKQTGDIILTFDADFLQPRSDAKVIYIDLHPRDPYEADRLLKKWINKCLTVLDEGNVVKLTKNGPVLERH